MKFKTEIVSPKKSPNTSIMIKKKGNRKSNTKFSPEENLGLKLEKLIEKGVKVKKIDSPEVKKSPKLPKIEPFSKLVTPSKVKVTGGGVSLKPTGSESTSFATVKKKSPKKKNSGTEFSNGSSEIKEENKQNKSDDSAPVPVNRLDLSMIIPAVKCCLENAKSKDKKNKLIDIPDPLYMIITVLKKGVTASHMCRFNLPHKLVRDDADVCFIVRDKKGQSIEKTIEDFEELLQINGIKQIKKILTYRQLREEYSRHELRRKLCNAYDFFVADGRLSKSLLRHLGKHFVIARKIPIYIRIDKNFKDNITKAFYKTPMKIKSTQDSFSCVIGNRSFSAKDIAENIVTVANSIKPDIFPGGWENVRSINVKTQTGALFPIYYSQVNPNSIETPVMAPKRPKAAVPVFGELNTADDAMVRVEPDGTVKIVKTKKAQQQSANAGKKKNVLKKDVDEEADDDDDDEEEEEEEEDTDENDESEDEEDTSDFDISDDEPSTIISAKSPQLSKAMKNNFQNDPEEDESGDDSDENDDESENDIGDKAELEYLQEMRGQLSSDDDDDDGDEDSDDEEIDNEEDEDDSDESESDDISTPPNGNKRKLSLENNKITTLSKRSKPDSVVDQTKSNNKGKGMFDTSLGETWDIRKKQQLALKSNNQKGGNKKKNANKNRKLSKSLRKANIKTKGKKNKNR